MKQLHFILFWVMSIGMWAQAPQFIPYQAVMRNADGTVMSNASMTITFKIHDVAATGAVVYEETHAVTSNSQGLVSLNVGGGNVVTGTFSGIQWGTGSKFLHVLMNAGNGNIDLGTQQMMSAPYALYADEVSVRVSLTGDSLFIGNQVSIVPGVSAANAVFGCTNVNACNYNFLANIDDNGCLFSGDLCSDGDDLTYNDIVNSLCQCVGSPIFALGQGVVDSDGNLYGSVIIKGVEWMAENLKTTKFNNGETIPNLTINSVWSASTSPGYCWYNNQLNNKSIYGGLYNWYAVDDQRQLCPTGWHVSTWAEWIALGNACGGYSEAGGKLKEVSNYWISPNVGASNLSGFSARPGGKRISNTGEFSVIGMEGYWWTSYEQVSWSAFKYSMTNNSSLLDWGSAGYNKKHGLSVRCVKN